MFTNQGSERGRFSMKVVLMIIAITLIMATIIVITTSGKYVWINHLWWPYNNIKEFIRCAISFDHMGKQVLK